MYVGQKVNDALGVTHSRVGGDYLKKNERTLNSWIFRFDHFNGDILRNRLKDTEYVSHLHHLGLDKEGIAAVIRLVRDGSNHIPYSVFLFLREHKTYEW